MLKTAKFLNLVVVLVMLLDVVGAITMVQVGNRTQHSTFNASSLKSCSIAKVLFVKEAEEESETSGDKRDKVIGAELIDFLSIFVGLSNVHTPKLNFVSPEVQFTVRPTLFTLHCVFQI